MALNNSSQGGITYINIKKGALAVRNKNKEIESYTDITGKIYDVKFKIDSYKDKEFEIAQIFLSDKGENYCLQMRTDSGYFRGFCNSLKTGSNFELVNIRPYLDVKDGKNKTTIFVSQNGKTLKHYHTVNNMGDLPSVKKVTFKGKEEWDGSEQLEYWKNWLSSQIWDEQEEVRTPEIKKEQNVKESDDDMIDDDLPF
jgi:hypothetical protein